MGLGCIRPWRAVARNDADIHSPTDPDGLAVVHALSREGLSSEDGYNALEGLRNMTGRDVQARLDALESKIDILRTMITWGWPDSASSSRRYGSSLETRLDVTPSSSRRRRTA